MLRDIRTTIQSEETIKQFGLAAKWVGVKYREYFNKDHTNNVFTDLFANIKNWFDRQDAIETWKHMAVVPDVQAALQSFEENSRRHFVPSTIKASRNKSAGEQAYKKQRHEDMVRKIGGMDEL